ncbi:MAG: Sec-independent protein translocase protein TatB [Pseudomonadota bacterium]|uniref:Sec-independent protein translocase protein TatB n=1 Tax=Thermithiobacillus tepidarius TaxID=929 RepID=UPI0003FC2D1F|nr:Sec-independent protein translocase protein TatB [Thermithiobacillus tepidarius]
MFNIGFSEMLVIGIIALIVVGPDKLPELARTVGRWVGAARRMVADVKAEVDEQLLLDEIARRNREIMEMDALGINKKPAENQASVPSGTAAGGEPAPGGPAAGNPGAAPAGAEAVPPEPGTAQPPRQTLH